MVAKNRGTNNNKKVKIKPLPLIIASVVLILLVSASLFAVLNTGGEVTEPPDDKETDMDLDELTEDDKEDEESEEEEIARCEYCGTPMEDREQELSRPVAITLGNSAPERPHSGINSACVMYEVPAEGNATRLQAVFDHEYPERIGPVRSARYYTITLALEHDAIYAHVQGYQPVMNKISNLNVATINEYGDGAAFWRADHRNAPHDAYITVENMLEAAENRGYREEGNRDSFVTYEADYEDHDETPQNFITEYDQGEHAETAEEISVSYYGNVVEYFYSSDEDKYERHIGGEPHLDDQDDQVVMAQDLIFQFVDGRVIDDVGRRELDMIGDGEGMYLAGGEVIPLTWEKGDYREPTEFYHAETGEPLQVRPGLTWVNVIPNDIRDNVSY